MFKKVLLVLFNIIVLGILMLPAILFPNQIDIVPSGDHVIQTTLVTWEDKNRLETFTNDGSNRHVSVKFWYPVEDGNYPLIVFSHGAFGIKDSNESAYKELASHGYVVCSIDHPGHSFYTKSEDGKVVLVNKDYMNEVTYSNEEAHYTKPETYELIKKWMKIRTEDINFTIDTILQNAAQVVQSNIAAADTNNEALSSQMEAINLYRLVDRDKIGVFGHSMGAAASVQMGRERKDIDSVINIDGPYFSEMFYDVNKDEFVATGEQYDIPILNIYSDQVWVQLQNGTSTGVYAGNKISDQICKNSYDVYLKGTKHLTLTDLSLASPFLADLLDGEKAKVNVKKSIELENSLILEFFDATLKGQGEFSSEGI